MLYRQSYELPALKLLGVVSIGLNSLSEVRVKLGPGLIPKTCSVAGPDVPLKCPAKLVLRFLPCFPRGEEGHGKRRLLQSYSNGPTHTVPPRRRRSLPRRARVHKVCRDPRGVRQDRCQQCMSDRAMDIRPI